MTNDENRNAYFKFIDSKHAMNELFVDYILDDLMKATDAIEAFKKLHELETIVKRALKIEEE